MFEESKEVTCRMHESQVELVFTPGYSTFTTRNLESEYPDIKNGVTGEDK